MQEDNLKNAGNQTIPIPFDFYIIVKNSNGSQWEPKLFGYQYFLNCLLFVLCLGKNVIHGTT